MADFAVRATIVTSLGDPTAATCVTRGRKGCPPASWAGTKPVGQDVFSRRRSLNTLAALVAGIGAGCSSTLLAQSRQILQPVFSLGGTKLVRRMDLGGGFAADAQGTFTPFVFPVAVAAFLNDVYIADAGKSRLYRLNRNFDAMIAMPDVRVGPTTRLQTGPDGSIYVLNTQASETRRYARGGQAQPSLRPRLASSRYTDFTVDAASGKGYAIDSAHLVVDEIHALGLLSTDAHQVPGSGPITANGRSLFIASAGCACVTEWTRGRLGRRFGAGKLHQPRSIAIVDQNLYGLSGFDRSIARAHEKGVESFLPGAMGLLMPESLASSGGLLYVADGAGRKLSAFRPKPGKSL